MQILFELSKEHPTLPVAEIRACLKTYKMDYEEIYHNGIYIAELNDGKLKKIANRLAMSYSINEIIGKNEKEFIEKIRKSDYMGSFKVEGGSYNLRKRVGEIVVKEKKLKVDLKNPDIIIKVCDGYFCRELYKIDRSQFEDRRPNKRIYSMPTTMHPRLARALINLAELKENEIMLDPFCGTGGILIEAGLLGIKTIGIEIKRELVKGCKMNLEYYGIKNYEIYESDMREMDIKADAVVTDFPYGRASHLSDKMDKLYRDAIKKLAEFATKAVIGLPSLKYNELLEKYFYIEQIHPVRVHKSLTRFFYKLTV